MPYEENEFDKNLSKITKQLDTNSRLFLTDFYRIASTRDPYEKQRLYQNIMGVSQKIALLRWVLSSLN